MSKDLKINAPIRLHVVQDVYGRMADFMNEQLFDDPPTGYEMMVAIAFFQAECVKANQKMWAEKDSKGR